MARPLRIEFEGAIYHVCARGNAREDIFRTEADRVRFLKLLEQSVERFAGAVFCFVLMSNHFHLVVRTARPNLSAWMQWLSVSYSVYFNRRHKRSGHLFQGRYKSFLVDTGEYLLSLSRYIHLNPVRGRLIGQGTPAERRERLREFKWSSYRGFAGLTKSFPFVDESMVLDELTGSAKNGRIEYRRFVEEGLVREIDNPFEAVKWQAALGRETFLRKIRDRMKGFHKHQREITSLRNANEFPAPEAILNNVARKFRVSAQSLTQQPAYGLAPRNIAMWIIAERCGMSLRQIGELFGGLDYAAVAQRIRRARNKYSEKEARALLTEMSNV
jgi:REP element-mobilizing transposase RayT